MGKAGSTCRVHCVRWLSRVSSSAVSMLDEPMRCVRGCDDSRKLSLARLAEEAAPGSPRAVTSSARNLVDPNRLDRRQRGERRVHRVPQTPHEYWAPASALTVLCLLPPGRGMKVSARDAMSYVTSGRAIKSRGECWPSG